MALAREVTLCSKITVSHKQQKHCMYQTYWMNTKVGTRTKLVSITDIKKHRTMQYNGNSFENCIIYFCYSTESMSFSHLDHYHNHQCLKYCLSCFHNLTKDIEEYTEHLTLGQYIGILSSKVTQSQKCHMKQIQFFMVLDLWILEI